MACLLCGIVRLVSVAAVLGLTIGNALAGESTVGAYVGGRVAHTDNLNLSAADGEDASVMEVSTGINFDRLQPRIDAHVAYDVQGLFYEDSTLDQVYQQLDARTNFSLIAERLFLDAFAVYDQTIADPTAQFSFNNLTVNNNRADIAVAGLSPSLALDVGENVVGELRYRTIWSDYDDEALQDASVRSTTLNLGNADLRRGGTWALAYEREQFEYDFLQDIEFETFAVELGYWIGQTVRVFTTQGLESDYSLVFATTGPSPGLDDHYWDTGIEVRLNERADLTLRVGHRNFGETRGVSASYATRYGRFSASYTEEPSSFVRDQAFSAQTTGELAQIDNLASLDANIFYLQKRGDVSYVLERAKSRLGFRVYKDRRFDLAAALGGVEQESESYGGAEIWFDWDFSVVWAVIASAQVATRTFALRPIDEEFDYVALDFNRRIGEKGQLSFLVSRETAQPTSEFEEHQVSVSFQRSYGANAAGGVPARYSGLVGASPGR
jgi:uncharacterized protein (PEP-CTERM system associated)